MNRYVQLSREISNSLGARQEGRPVPNLQSAENFIEPVPSGSFIEAMRGAVTGVNIVTTDGPAGRFGVTVSASCSVSAEPPQVLVCINRTSPVCEAIVKNGCFCLNTLAVGQRDLANVFAGFADEGIPYDFKAAHWKGLVTGAPGLEGAIAGFDCVLGSSLAAGTHRIFIGRVVAVTSQPDSPLLYTNRGYGHPANFD